VTVLASTGIAHVRPTARPPSESSVVWVLSRPRFSSMGRRFGPSHDDRHVAHDLPDTCGRLSQQSQRALFAEERNPADIALDGGLALAHAYPRRDFQKTILSSPGP
jgi:hypothetical protein